MSNEKTRLVGTFFSAGGTIRLRANIGDRQVGAVTVLLEGNEVPLKDGECVLGDSKELRHKGLAIAASVTDTNQFTNNTSFTVVIKDDFTEDTYALSKVAQQGGQVEYAMIIEIA